MTAPGGKTWLTAAEIAALALPGLPRDKRKVNERADKEAWALRTSASGAALSRRRRARGGGQEYHIDVLPVGARAELARRGLADIGEQAPEAPDASAGSVWAWYERQTDAVKEAAERRAAVLDLVAAQEARRAGIPA